MDASQISRGLVDEQGGGGAEDVRDQGGDVSCRPVSDEYYSRATFF